MTPRGNAAAAEPSGAASLHGGTTPAYPPGYVHARVRWGHTSVPGRCHGTRRWQRRGRGAAPPAAAGPASWLQLTWQCHACLPASQLPWRCHGATPVYLAAPRSVSGSRSRRIGPPADQARHIGQPQARRSCATVGVPRCHRMGGAARVRRALRCHAASASCSGSAMRTPARSQLVRPPEGPYTA